MIVLTLKIVNYDRTNNTIVNYNLKTLIVQATGLFNEPTGVELTRPRTALAYILHHTRLKYFPRRNALAYFA